MKWLASLLLAIVGAATAVSAHPPVTARLATCGERSCVLLRGYRADLRATVSVNGRPVEATGGRAWRALLPVQTVRDWSSAYARTIRVAIESDATAARDETVRLPIGLLGGKVELAALVVRAR